MTNIFLTQYKRVILHKHIGLYQWFSNFFGHAPSLNLEKLKSD